MRIGFVELSLLFGACTNQALSFYLCTGQRSPCQPALQNRAGVGSVPKTPPRLPAGRCGEHQLVDAVGHRHGHSSALFAVEYFDGSQIVDPVIVSNVFWSKLQSNFLSILIGQFLAASVFGVFLSIASSQFVKIVDFATGALTPKPSNSPLNVPADLSVDGTAKRRRDIDVKKLAICLIIDIIGTSSEAIPIVGEVTDLLWAPIAATALRSLFGGNNIVFVLEFAEEILPFTDILPLATFCWVVDTFYEESDVAKALGLGVYQPPKQP
jgi:hypothetical protein